MSITWLPREMGMVVRCNGCSEKFHTGNIVAKHTRAWLKKERGWGRGSRAGTKIIAGTKRHDLCPSCLKLDKELAAQDAKKKQEWKAQRAEARKAKLAGKRAPSAASASTSSPSADSAPAPAT